MAQSEKFMPFFFDWREPFKELSGDECKALLLAMLDYRQFDIEPPEFSGSAKIAASFLFPALERSKRNAAAGKKGGQATASKIASSGATSESQAQKQKQTTKTKTRTKTTSKTDEGADADEMERRFDGFWNCYPKKVGKATAQKAWEKLAPDEALFEVIVQAVELQKRSPQWCKDGGQFIPNPSTWLNQKRWEDDTSQIQLPGAGSAPIESGDPFLSFMQRAAKGEV